MIYIIIEGGLVQEARTREPYHVIDCDNFENGACPVCDEDLEEYICPSCKTDWTVQKMNYDELIKIANRKFVCQHAEHEDCMYCINCGSECREDLDEEDMCPECAKKETISIILDYLAETEECYCEDLENGQKCIGCMAREVRQ